MRVARVNGGLVTNPGPSELGYADMDLLVAGTEGHVLMLEMNGAQVVGRVRK